MISAGMPSCWTAASDFLHQVSVGASPTPSSRQAQQRRLGLGFLVVVLDGEVLHQPVGEETCLLPLADPLGPVLAGEGQQLGLMLPAPIACRFEFVIER